METLAHEFDPAVQSESVQPPALRDIETITGEILEAQKTGGEAILTIGRGLIEAKAVLSHGEWLDWLETVGIRRRGAQRLMQLAQTYSNASALTHLGQTKALMLAVLSEDDRNAFIAESHLVNGEEKTVFDMTSRELESAIRERDEALKAAEQAKAAQKAADEAKRLLSEEIALNRERILNLNAEVAAQSSAAKEAHDTAARLEKELEELRFRPVEVAVEVDSAAVEAARKEVEAAMQNKLDRATKARDKALQKRYDLEAALSEAKDAQKAAEDAKVSAQQELERVQAEARAIREQAERTEKKAAIAANGDLVLFRTLFDQIQEQVNKLSGVLMKVRNKDQEKAEGLKKALVSLADNIREVAEQ